MVPLYMAAVSLCHLCAPEDILFSDARTWTPSPKSADHSGHGERSHNRESATMWDIFYIAITVVFFIVAAAFVRGCDRL
jgi:hypothetical protein